jgi:uncharacterized protein (DUF2141 family)
VRTTTASDIAAARDADAQTDATQVSSAMTTVSMFFPNSRDLASALPIELAASEERTGINLTLAEAKSLTLTGTILGVDGRPSPTARVMLWPAAPYLPTDQFSAGIGDNTSYGGLVSVSLPPSAKFVIRGLTAGRYALLAMTPLSGEMQWARQTIEMLNDDQELTVNLAAALQLQGRIATAQGSTPDAKMLAKVGIVLRSVDEDGSSSVAPPRARVNPDGTFTVTGILPGRYSLSVADLATPWSATSAIQNGRDILDGALLIERTDVPPLTVTLTDQPSELVGVFSEPSGLPATDYFVVVFDEDPKQWFLRSRRVVAIRPNSDGSFLVRNLPAGRYRVAAVTDVQQDEWFEPAFLTQLVPASVVVTVQAGQRTEQNLRVGK